MIFGETCTTMTQVEGMDTGSITHTISIAVLVTGKPAKITLETFGGYETMFARQLQEALQAIPRFHYHQKKVLQVGAFDVTAGELPDEEELGEGQWDALIVTGSRAYWN